MTEQEEQEMLKEFAKAALPFCLKRQINLRDQNPSSYGDVSPEKAAAQDAFHTARVMIEEYDEQVHKLMS